MTVTEATPLELLACKSDSDRRAALVADPALHGIDYVEVITEPEADNQRLLEIHLIDKPGRSALIDQLVTQVSRFSVEGGTRVTEIQVTEVRRVGDHLVLRVDEPGDFSTYTLAIGHSALDPVYSRVEFSFKAGCPSRFDCRPSPDCPPALAVEPTIDYMARDYASFRQALVDLMPQLVPGWRSDHPADLSTALVELLAYTGDQLAYYQDAVANEAYLETARRRVSVRRHVRLVDYRMHEGLSARAFVRFAVSRNATISVGDAVLTAIDVPLEPGPPPRHGIRPALRADAEAAAAIAFSVIEGVDARPGIEAMQIYAWDKRECCLPRGATTIDLDGDFDLRDGDLLMLEEVRGPESTLEADADPNHRQVVRVRSVQRHVSDPLHPARQITRVRWKGADALRFPLCVSVVHERRLVTDVSVARGNVALVEHGRRVDEWHPGDPLSNVPGIEPGRRAYRFELGAGPLAWGPRIDPADRLPAAEIEAVGPHGAAPRIERLTVREEGSAIDDQWDEVPDLLDAAPGTQGFVVEPAERGRASVRFGDDEFGRAAPRHAHVQVRYRIGAGAGGNVGLDALRHVVCFDSSAIADVTNPLPAWGGTEPQSIEEVRQLAPAAFRATQDRAVTEADYAAAVERLATVSRAAATFRWTGSWHTVFLTVDPVGRAGLTPDLEREVRAHAERFAQAGYDLEVRDPSYVPLDVVIDVCAEPDRFRTDVEVGVLEALGPRDLAGGRRGFFHPDEFTLGQPVYTSALYAAVQAVDGVSSAVVRRLRRIDRPDPGMVPDVLPVGPLEVVRLDNDPSAPDNGVLTIEMRGGR